MISTAQDAYSYVIPELKGPNSKKKTKSQNPYKNANDTPHSVTSGEFSRGTE